MDDRILNMDNMFDKWYATLTDAQRVRIGQFCRIYPLKSIEEDILSFAKMNDIEVEVPPCVITQLEVEEEGKEEKRIELVKCDFIPLVKSEDTSSIKTDEDRVELFKAKLCELFVKAKTDHITKKVTFYCMCPFMERLEVAADKDIGKHFGIFGTFHIAA